MPMLEARNLSVTIERKSIVEGVDFSARAGEVTAIVGPNGSGKSTFLKALCRDLPYAGAVFLNGRNLEDMKPYQVATMRAVLPQASVLTFPFTVNEVVRMGLTMGVSGADARAQALLPAEALKRVDLEGFGGRMYQSLSGGEQQRVQLARVLCQVWQPVLDGVPRFLLLDEPVSSLDVKHQLLIMDIARAFAREGGGVVAILHDLNLAALYADKVMALRKGRSAAFGAPVDVLDRTLVRDVFDCDLDSIERPSGGRIFAPPAPQARVPA
jgi:iron complex transport system ATP-binding protein